VDLPCIGHVIDAPAAGCLESHMDREGSTSAEYLIVFRGVQVSN